MAAGHVTEHYGFRDGKLRLLLTDTGSAPTYDTYVDVPGVTEMSVTPQIESAQLEGDDEVIARRGRPQKIELEITFVQQSLDILPILLGGTVSDVDGTLARYRQLDTDSLPYFRFDGEVASVAEGLGGTRCVFYKCQVTDAEPFGMAQLNDFGEFSFTAEAIPLASNGRLIDVYHSTAAIDLTAEQE